MRTRLEPATEERFTAEALHTTQQGAETRERSSVVVCSDATFEVLKRWGGVLVPHDHFAPVVRTSLAARVIEHHRNGHKLDRPLSVEPEHRRCTDPAEIRFAGCKCVVSPRPWPGAAASDLQRPSSRELLPESADDLGEQRAWKPSLPVLGGQIRSAAQHLTHGWTGADRVRARARVRGFPAPFP